MMMGFDKAKAETVVEASNYKTISQWLWERGDIENNPYAESGNAFGMGFGENFAEAVQLWKSIGENVWKVVLWINNLRENIEYMSVELLAWVYKTLSMLVLHTPVLLFTNEWFKDNMMTFTSLSVSMFAIAFMFQVIKKMLSAKDFDKTMQHTEPKTIIKRYALAITGIGFAPFLFEKGFGFVNTIAKFITSLGYHEVKNTSFEETVRNKCGSIEDPTSFNSCAENVSSMMSTNVGDTLALIGFDIVLIGTLVPIFLANGRRWFDLVCLGALTPVALSAWCFNDTKHYTSQWWKAIKDIGMVQIVYSFFIAIMGVFMLGTRGFTSGFGLIFKLAIMAGGLYRMSNPPQFLSRMMDSSNASVLTMYDSLKNTLGMANITKYKPVNVVKNALWRGMNAGKMQEARSVVGQRFIGETPTEARKTLSASKKVQKRLSTGKRYNK